MAMCVIKYLFFLCYLLNRFTFLDLFVYVFITFCLLIFLFFFCVFHFLSSFKYFL